MNQEDYLGALDGVTRKINEARSVRALGQLGPRLGRTASFHSGQPELTEGLVSLRERQTGEDPIMFAARVLPGGKLVEPLARVDPDGSWTSIPSIPRLARADLVPIDSNHDADKQHLAAIWFAVALTANEKQIARLRQRAQEPKSVFKPCLDLYDAKVSANPDKPRTEDLTDTLLGAREQAVAVIQQRARDKGLDPEGTMRSVINSLRRSAGTNYQGLVALAIADELHSNRSVWYIHYPPPKDYIQSLALRFTPKPGMDVEIDPDIDILIKNAAWTTTANRDEPVVLLSVKTSLADRAGAAARWKMYFDVATHSCPFDGQLDGCAWHDQGLRFAKPDLKVRLMHCIVTANIYKVSSDPRYAEEGELQTAQTKANTFMFDKRYATRTGDRVGMEGWEPLTELTTLLKELSLEQNLPY